MNRRLAVLAIAATMGCTSMFMPTPPPPHPQGDATYDKLTDSTRLVGDPVYGTIVGDSANPLKIGFGITPEIWYAGQQKPPRVATVALVFKGVLISYDSHATAEFDVGAPSTNEVILLLDDSVRTRIPVHLATHDSNSLTAGLVKAEWQYVGVVPVAMFRQLARAHTIEGKLYWAPFAMKGADLMKWLTFADYIDPPGSGASSSP